MCLCTGVALERFICEGIEGPLLPVLAQILVLGCPLSFLLPNGLAFDFLSFASALRGLSGAQASNHIRNFHVVLQAYMRSDTRAHPRALSPIS